MPEFLRNHQKLNRMDFTVKLVLLILIILPLSFVLVLLEKTWLPYSAFVEEITKGLMVLFIILTFANWKQKVWAGVLFGSLFGLSENIFYLMNIIENGNLNIFWQRMLLVTPMHIITVLIILLSALKNKKLIILGLTGAIIIHSLFNHFIVKIGSLIY